MKKLTLAALLCMAWLGEAGNGNVVVGNGNVVRGNQNFAQGDNNAQDGDRTRIVGSNNFNRGDDRDIIGDDQYFSSERPEDQEDQRDNSEFGEQHPHHANFELSETVTEARPLGPHLTSEPVRVHPNPGQVNTGAQVLNTFTPDFLEQKRLQIV
jgi:hypothetical protein